VKPCIYDATWPIEPWRALCHLALMLFSINTVRGCILWVCAITASAISVVGIVAIVVLGRWDYLPAYLVAAYLAYLLLTIAAGLRLQPTLVDAAMVAAAVAALVTSAVNRTTPSAVPLVVGGIGLIRLAWRARDRNP
jgi:hypothetical protein